MGLRDPSFTAIGDKMGTDGSLTETISDLVWNGLTILTGSKTKYGTASVNGESQKFIQWGGGKANGDRSCYFTAPASGKLTVVASNTGSSEDATRLVSVTVNGETFTQVGGTSFERTYDLRIRDRGQRSNSGLCLSFGQRTALLQHQIRITNKSVYVKSFCKHGLPVSAARVSVIIRLLCAL